jgi:nickel-dependent lactate racemase
LPVDFLVNVTLNRAKEITSFFCGDVLAVHERSCEANKVPKVSFALGSKAFAQKVGRLGG